MLDYFGRVQILNESLPLLKQCIGRTIVVKYGGSAMKSQHLKDKVIEDVLYLAKMGIKLVFVHGGGPIINNWLRKINIEPKFDNGVRVTDKETMEMVEMVLAGKVNKNLVKLLNKQNGCAVGLCGQDANLVVASSLFNVQENFVGTVKMVNTNILTVLLDSGYIPIIASVAADENGQVYNINADTFAGAIADALCADKLILLTDTPGIMYDINDPKTLVKHLNLTQAQNLGKDKVISGGMIPKVECCIKALQGNVKSTHIIDGRIEHSLLLEILTVGGIGSMITL
uniref:Acetylglutamate kinase n=1 Tax=Schimmelmannia schousboei TaxID=173468 RepID=A0A1C9C8Y1_9FLOR|nr:acetylglutamate kinase [Schimmelmannia schousboei]AOM64846.1 acetylglutamate kinase [Schimmelmannia schousboei]